MSQCNPDIFMSKPDGDVFFALKRKELMSLARHLELHVEVKNLMPRAYIHLKDTKSQTLSSLSAAYQFNWSKDTTGCFLTQLHRTQISEGHYPAIKLHCKAVRRSIRRRQT